MKKIYGIYDCVACEVANVFIANNDEHAKLILKNAILKAPLEITVKLVVFSGTINDFQIVDVFEPLDNSADDK